MSSSNRRTNSNVKQKDGRDRTKQFKDFVDRRNKDRSQQRSSRTSPPTSSRLSFHSEPVAKADSIGKVTQIDKDCGVVNDEVFFSVRVCRGQVPKLGSRVLYEAHPGTSTLRRQCSWIATRIQELEPPSSSSRSRSSAANKDGVAPDSRRRRCSPEDEGKSSLEIIQQGWEELERSRQELRQSRAELERSREELEREQLQRRSRELHRSRSRERHESQHWEREPEPVVVERRQHSNERHYSNRMEKEPLCPSQQWSEQTSEQVRHAVREWDRTPLQIESRPQQQRWQEPENNIRQSRCELEDGFRNHMAIMEQQQHREQLQSRSRSPENVYQMQQQCDNYMREDEKEQSTNYRRSQEKWHSSNPFAPEIELRESRREPQSQSRRLSPATNIWQMQDHPRITPNEGISEMRGNSEENRDWCWQSQNKHDMLIETTQNESSNNHLNMREELIFQNQERRDQSQSHIRPSSGLPANARHCELKDFQSHQSFNRDIHDRKWEMTQNERPRYSNNEEWREQTRASNNFLQSEEPHKLFQDQQMQNSIQDIASTDFGADSNLPPLLSQKRYKPPSFAQRQKLAKELAKKQIKIANYYDRARERNTARALKKKTRQNKMTPESLSQPELPTQARLGCQMPQFPNSLGIVEPRQHTPPPDSNLPSLLSQEQYKRDAQRRKLAIELAKEQKKIKKEKFHYGVRERRIARALKKKTRRNKMTPESLSQPELPTQARLGCQMPQYSGIVEPRQQAPPPPIISQQPSNPKNIWISTSGRPNVPESLQKNNMVLTNQLLKKRKLTTQEKQEVKHNCWCIIVDEAHSKGFIEDRYSNTFDQKFRTALASANLTSLVERCWMNKQHVYQITLASPNCGSVLQSFVAKHFFKPWSVAKLRLITVNELTVVNVFVPFPGGRYSPKEILKNLQNKELHTHLWCIQKSFHSETGIKIWVAIDDKSYQFLVKNRGLISYYQTKILFMHGDRVLGKGVDEKYEYNDDNNFDDNGDDDNDNGDDNGEDDYDEFTDDDELNKEIY